MTISGLSMPSLPARNSVRAQRLHGVDLLRAVCAVLVVMLHAAIPYMSHPLPGLIWSIQPAEKSGLVNLIGWSIDGFIMPIFFLMNGYFAARLLHQRGERLFVGHRLARIGGPFLLACLVILPLDLYIWLTGWVISDLIPIRKLRSLKIGGELGATLHCVSHLWFLQYVLLYCLGMVAWLRMWKRLVPATRPVNKLFRSIRNHEAGSVVKFSKRSETKFGNVLRGVVLLLVGSLVSGSVLWLQPRIVIGFRFSFFPLWENLIYYAVPFLMGWFWEKHSPAESSTKFRWGCQLAVAAGLFLLLWPELNLHLQNATTPARRAGVPFLFAAFGLLTATGLFGAILSLHIPSIPGFVNYLSKASFWIYLFHHPVVGLVQIDLLPLNIPAWSKFLLATITTLLFCVLTYEGLVRCTWVGQLLNGVKEPRTIRSRPEFTEQHSTQRQAA